MKHKSAAAGAICAAAFFMSTGTAAMANVIDFDTTDGSTATTSGNITGDEFQTLGFTITTDDPDNEPLALFNSDCGEGPDSPSAPDCTGNDPDLASGPGVGTEPQGNVLIINEAPGDTDDPDDTNNGGSITFSFEMPVEIDYITILDLDNGEPVEEGSITFEFALDGLDVYAVDDPVITTEGGEANGDNSLTTFDYDFDGQEIDEITITFARGTTAAVAEIGLVPLPGTLPLLAGALGLAGLAARRKKRAA